MSRRYDLGYGNSQGKGVRLVTSPFWHYGRVVNIDDPYKAGRIQVRIIGSASDGLDDDVPQSLETASPEKGGLPWCNPLLPMFVNVIPRVGEMVKIATFDYRNKKNNRQYIGPVIGQQVPPDLLSSEFIDTETKLLGGYSPNWDDNPDASTKDKIWSIYPDYDEIGVLGRRNTDIILKDTGYYDEIILRSGKIDSDSLKKKPTNGTSPYILNTKNPGYITINFTESNAFNNSLNPDVKKLKLTKDRSHINLVADKINLISHEGSPRKGVLLDKIIKGNDVLTQSKIENQKLHPIPYGDVLWEFMEVLGNYIFNHIHEGSRLPPDADTTKKALENWYSKNMGVKKTEDGNIIFDNCQFLSKGVKTN